MNLSHASLKEAHGRLPDAACASGPFGGRYVAETLMPALLELEAASAARRRLPSFRKTSPACAITPAGRRRSISPTASPRRPAARHLPQARGPDPHRRPQDQQHARPGAARPADGQAAASSPKPAPASTASPPRPWPPCFGLECEVFMGEEDIRRQAPNVLRMKLLGAEVVPVDLRLADPQGRHERGHARLGGDGARHLSTCIGSVVGPHPYPDDGPRLSVGHRRRGQAADAGGASAGCRMLLVACVGGGSNAHRAVLSLPRRRDVALIGVEAGGRGHRQRRARRHPRRGRVGRAPRHPSPMCFRTRRPDPEVHSISAGLDYPGVGPEHAFLKDTGRVRYVSRHGRRGPGGLSPPVPAGRDHPGPGERPRRWPGPCKRRPALPGADLSSSTSRAAATRTSASSPRFCEIGRRDTRHEPDRCNL